MSERSERYTVPMGEVVGKRPPYWYAPETLAPRPVIMLGYLVQAVFEIEKLMADTEENRINFMDEHFDAIRLRLDQAEVMYERLRHND